MTYIWVAFLIVTLLVVSVALVLRRHRRDHREHLEPVLAKHGYEYISSRWPGLFRTGPFPKFEIEVGVAQSHKMGVRGEYDTYRVVHVRDRDGNTFVLWACIVFEAFRVREIRWRIANQSDMPEGMEQLLEQGS
jgi:hypothetical protein